MLKSPERPTRPRNGFLLMEVVLALGIFAIACTGLTVAFHRMAETASIAQNELRITRILDSAIAEQISFPTLEEGTTQIPIEGTDIELDVEITPIEDLANMEAREVSTVRIPDTVTVRRQVNPVSTVRSKADFAAAGRKVTCVRTSGSKRT